VRRRPSGEIPEPLADFRRQARGAAVGPDRGDGDPAPGQNRRVPQHVLRQIEGRAAGGDERGRNDKLILEPGGRR
jgi:hypothetical protein